MSSDHESVTRERVRRLFQFLRAFNDQRHPVPRQLEEQPWQYDLSEVPQHPCVGHARGGSSGLLAGADGEAIPRAHEVILSVRRPATTQAPEPPASARPFLRADWQDPFVDDGGLPGDMAEADLHAFAAWREARNAWARTEQAARRALALFEELYALYALMEREGERHELVLGDGMLYWNHKDGPIKHPILLQRLSLEFDASRPEFRLRESGHPPEIYAGLLATLSGVDGLAIARIREKFDAHPCHPLGAADTAEFLSFLAVQLSARGHVVTIRPGPAPEDPLIVRGPYLFQRTHTLGFSTALEAILEDLAAEGTSRYSPALTRIAGIEPFAPGGRLPGVEESFAADQIVLSKPANPEQIRIVERLDSHGAVLVQGPPGTGKTHTIANLIGHLLAHGKTVLVTAETTKALRVVRNQVDERLRPLCVSLLDNDLDGRKQLEEAVSAIADDISHEDADDLRRRAREKTRRRLDCVKALEVAQAAMFEARSDEYRALKIFDETLSPSDAARELARDAATLGFIPGAVRAPLSLELAELAALYRTNRTTQARDERDFEAGPLPEVSDLPVPDQLEPLFLGAAGKLASARAEWWPVELAQEAITALSEVVERIAKGAASAQTDTPWQLAALHAGMKGGAQREPWAQLLREIAATEALVADAQEHFVRHAPYVELLADEDPLLAVNAELSELVAKKGSLGTLDVLFRRRFREYLRYASVGGVRPTRVEHFAALAHYLRVRKARRELATRWARLIEANGGPSAIELGAEVEVGAKPLAKALEMRLDWYAEHCAHILELLAQLGFRWSTFLSEQPAPSGPHGEVERLRDALQLQLPGELHAKLFELRAESADEQLARVASRLSQSIREEQESPASALVRAIKARDAKAYREAHERVLALTGLREELEQRSALLMHLEVSAPAWAQAIRERSGVHGAGAPPGNVERAFRWALINTELERRSARSLSTLRAECELRTRELAAATTQVIEARAWLAQKERMTLAEQQALTGWLDTQRAIGKGTGKKVPELKAEARRLMSRCQTAVPVWIMPLSRLVESFDARSVRFDVVIIDEASQCDLLALVALHLGRQAVVVGDHEQVSPSAVGDNIDASSHLITQHLSDIPNAHLYDGKLSVYDLARQSFGGVLALREHFRSLPPIIEFSNQLSYGGKILPLRDGGSAKLLPCTLAFRVDGASSSGKVNLAEARAVAALIVAASEQPEYDGATFGVVSLLGQEQAYEIDALLRQVLSPTELERRRIVCGNAAHFQGDERDVMFLSLVDVSTEGPLPLRDQQSFKQRFNVAASRARDQMWVVHSLDPHRDLKPQDLRRRLILHAQAGGTSEREQDSREPRHRSAFEREVFEALTGAGYRVRSSVRIGEYRIDLVVEGSSGKRVALTCDGDEARPHGLQEDIARQAVLERIGWRFVRIRGSEFLRAPEASLTRIRGELEALDILPQAELAPVPPASDLAERVMARAREVMSMQFEGSKRAYSGSFEARLRARKASPKRERKELT